MSYNYVLRYEEKTSSAIKALEIYKQEEVFVIASRLK